MKKSSLDLEVPSVHLGGTSKEELMRQYLQANTQIREAIEALQQATPHGRDYVLTAHQSHDRLQAALEQHRWRVKLLEQVQRELEYLIEQIDVQGRR